MTAEFPPFVKILSEEQVAGLHRMLGNTSGTTFFGYGIGHSGDARLTFTYTPWGISALEDLEDKLSILDLFDGPLTDHVDYKPRSNVWLRPSRANPPGCWGPVAAR